MRDAADAPQRSPTHLGGVIAPALAHGAAVRNHSAFILVAMAGVAVQVTRSTTMRS